MWIHVKKLLNSYGLGNETTDTFEVMLEQLNMSYDDNILAVCSTIIRPQFYPKCCPCEIRINNYMRNCLHIWRAFHDIQPCLSPYAMIEYILNYITKGQKGMSAQIEKACKDANKDNMDLKQSVQHIGNVFLNAVETGQEKAAFLLLQVAMTFMSREPVFINTSPPSERTFLVKTKKQLEQLDPDSTDISVDNLIRHYQNRPHQMENYCLADFALKVNICQQMGPSSKLSTVICFSQNTVYCRRKKDRIIRYVNYSKKKDPENHYRERLMLFFPWRNEDTDLKGNCDSYKEKYTMHKDDIEKICIHYEKFNEDLEEALENAANKEYEENMSTSGEEVENNTFGFFDPDHDENLKQYDIGIDLGIGTKKKKLKRKQYQTEVDCSGLHMNNDEYRSIMQMLNNKQYELCSHVMD